MKKLLSMLLALCLVMSVLPASGGTAAIPESVEEALADFEVIRLAGDTRFETNLAILEEAGVTDQEILVCTGFNFADSLSASATGRPILLVGGNGLSDAQTVYLDTLSGDAFTIIGGENAVSADVEAALNTYGEVDRIGGATRYETSVLVAERYFDAPEYAVLAYALNFPDGLCGGPLAHALHAPLILTTDSNVEAAAEYAAENSITRGVVLGGPGLIADNTANTVFGLDTDI